MIFDTDVMIWAQKLNPRALDLIGDAEERAISAVTYMELLHGSNSKKQLEIVRGFISEGNFQVLPLSEQIGHRAMGYVEQYSVLSGIRALDALIAATAVENNFMLVSGNVKHYKSLKDLKFKPFKQS